MVTDGYRNRQGADRTEVPLRPLVSLFVQLLVLELCCTLLACFLVLLAMYLLAVHAAVLDEATGRAVLEFDGVTPGLAAVCAGFFSFAITLTKLVVHCEIDVESVRVRFLPQRMGPSLYLYTIAHRPRSTGKKLSSTRNIYVL